MGEEFDPFGMAKDAIDGMRKAQMMGFAQWVTTMAIQYKMRPVEVIKELKKTVKAMKDEKVEF